MLSFFSFRTRALIVGISTFIQSAIWVGFFIIYILTYACVLNPYGPGGTAISQNIDLYLTAMKCYPSIILVEDFCGIISSNSPSIILGLLCVGVSLNVYLLFSSIFFLIAIWGNVNDRMAGRVRSNLINYLTSLFIVSGWDIALTGYFINDFIKMDKRPIACDLLSGTVEALFLLTSRGFIVLLINLISGFNLLSYTNNKPSVNRNVIAVENRGFDSNLSKINNEPIWTSHDQMAFGRQPPPHSAISKWPHLAALNQQEQSFQQQQNTQFHEDDEILSRWNVYGPVTNDSQDQQPIVTNRFRPQAMDLSRAPSMTSNRTQYAAWSNKPHRYDEVEESYESSPREAPKLNRIPSSASKQPTSNSYSDWTKVTSPSDQVLTPPPSAPVQPKKIAHLPSDAFKYTNEELFWNVKLRSVPPPPGIKEEEIKRSVVSPPADASASNSAETSAETSAEPSVHATTSGSPNPRPMSLQEAILTRRPLKTVKRPSLNIREN